MIAPSAKRPCGPCPAPSPVLDVYRAALVAGVTPNTVRKWCRLGGMTCGKLRRGRGELLWIVAESTLRAYVTRRWRPRLPVVVSKSYPQFKHV